MTRFLVFVLLAAMTALGTEISPPSVPADQASAVTFNKDVLPIVQKNCQTCHRPGGVAPMSFLTYESTRPWAKAIKAAVISREMPPWFADPHVGEFRNAPKLTSADITTLSAWADGGAREGDVKDKPPAVQWTDGWKIKPDVIVAMNEPHYVGAKGTGEIKQFFVQNPFKEDTWVSSIEIRPGDPSVVHHVIVQIPDGPSGSIFKMQAVADAQAKAAQQALQFAQQAAEAAQHSFFVSAAGGDVLIPQQGGGGSYSDIQARLNERRTGRGSFTTMEAVYAPGSQPLDFRFSDSAKLIKGGKPIKIEVHYTPNGKETTDQTMIGFTLAKAPAERRFVVMAPEHLVDSRKPIPAGNANYETKGELTFNQDADLVWFMPHMHLRGKDMSFSLIQPDGQEETVLNAKFNFHWQLGYELANPIHVTRGTRMIVTAHHDNSANNPLNPTPDRDVGWGEMTAQEMMLPWFGVVVDRDATPDAIATYKPGDLEPLPTMNPRVLVAPRAAVPQGAPLVQPAILRETVRANRFQ